MRSASLRCAHRMPGARAFDGSHTLAILKLLRDIKELVSGCNFGPELLGHADGRAVRVTDCKTCECTQFVPYNDHAAGYDTGRERRHRRRAASQQKQGDANCPKIFLKKCPTVRACSTTGELRIQTLILIPKHACRRYKYAFYFLRIEKMWDRRALLFASVRPRYFFDVRQKQPFVLGEASKRGRESSDAEGS